jgi:hypothetical protein
MKPIEPIFCFLLIIAILPGSSWAIDTEWVTVDGYSSLENLTKKEARQMAINDARRVAIEKVVGVEILSETLVINNEVSGDVICTLPYGKVLNQEILKEEVISVPSNAKGERLLLTYKVVARVQVAKEQGTADPFFRVKADINRKVFKEGDHIEIRITPTKDAYITVFNILEDQKVLILIPNRFRENNYVRANKTFVFPDENDRRKGITLEAFAGDGKSESREMFHILALKEPLKFDTANFSEGIFGVYDGSSGYVNDLVRETVGVPLAQRAETFIHYRIEK